MAGICCICNGVIKVGSKHKCNPHVIGGIEGAHRKAANEENFACEYETQMLAEHTRLSVGLKLMEMEEKGICRL